MSDISQGEGWWIASNGKWYPPEQHPDYQPPAPVQPAPQPTPAVEAPRWDAPTNPAPAGQVTANQPGVSTAEPEVLVATEHMATGKRGFGRWLPFALVTLVVLAGVGFLARSVLNSGSATGADSPEDALAGMVEAMNEEDALGIANLVDPQEFSAVTSALERLEADGVDLQGLPGGFDFTMHGLGGVDSPVDATFSPLGPEPAGLMVARMRGMEMGLVRATDEPYAFVGYDPDQVFVASAAEIEVGSRVEIELRDTGGGVEFTGAGSVNGEPLDRVDEFAESVPLEMVFIEHDGKWFMSLSYTIVNLAVKADAIPEPEYGRWRQVLADGTGGAETPTGAVERLFNALPALDVEEAVVSMDPLEARLLYDYLSILEREAEDEIQATLEEDGELEIVTLDLSEEVDGDTAKVFIDRVVLRVTDGDGGVTTIEADRSWCGYVDDGFGREGGCLDDVLREAQREFERLEFGVDIDLRELLPERPLLITSKREGRWYVSPLATFAEYGQELEPLVTGFAAQLERQFGRDTGFVRAEQASIGGTVEVTVPADGTAGVAITAPLDSFESASREDLAFHAVTLSADGAVDVQHDVERPWDDEVRGSFRMFEGETHEYVVFSRQDMLPRSHGLLLRNNSSSDVTVSVAVQSLDIVEIDGSAPYTDNFDDVGTPLVAVASEWFAMTATGAELTAFDFERLPWVQVRGSASVDDTFFVIVTGEPGAPFTLSDGG